MNMFEERHLVKRPRCSLYERWKSLRSRVAIAKPARFWQKREKRSHYRRSSQKATALAAATFRESTPWVMGMRTV